MFSLSQAVRLFHLFVMAIVAMPALAVPIVVTNPSFESRILACAPGPSCFALGDVPGWAVSTIPQTATFKPSSGTGGIFPAGVPDGVNVVGVGNETGTGFVIQTLSDNLLPNTLYALTAAVGRRADFPWAGYAIDLLAGSTLLLSSSAVNPAAGTFVFDTLIFQSSATTAGLGSPLAIRLRSLVTGTQADFDSVALVATPVSEPTTIALLLAGLTVVVAKARAIHRASAQELSRVLRVDA